MTSHINLNADSGLVQKAVGDLPPTQAPSRGPTNGYGATGPMSAGYRVPKGRPAQAKVT